MSLLHLVCLLRLASHKFLCQNRARTLLLKVEFGVVESANVDSEKTWTMTVIGIVLTRLC